MQLSLLAQEPSQALVLAQDAAREAYDKGVSENTLRVRKSQVAAWKRWLIEANFGVEARPTTENLALHVGWMLTQNYSRSSIEQRVASVRWLCGTMTWDDPTDCPQFKRLLRGVARTTSAPKGKNALTPQDIRAALERGEFTARERALILVGAVTGLRVGNLCALTWADVEFVEGGALIKVERSKTDQAGEGQFVAAPATGGKNCPLKALRDIPRVGSMFPVFGLELTDPRKVRLLVKKIATLAGKDPSNFSAHSFRAGLATTAHRQGVDIRNTQDALWHTKTDTTQRYVRSLEVMDNPAFRSMADALG